MLSIVIPCYNEEKRLPGTLAEVDRWAKANRIEVEVVVADDGSTDGTLRVARDLGLELPVKVVSLQRNTGKGAALKAGVEIAQGEQVLLMDADLCVPLDDYFLLEKAISGGVEAAIGSRYAPGAVITTHQPFLRRLGGRVFNLLVSLLVLPGFRDTQCGFKLFWGYSAKRVFRDVRSEGFEVDVEVIQRALLLGMRVREVGVHWAHVGESKVRIWRDSVRMARRIMVLKRALRKG